MQISHGEHEKIPEQVPPGPDDGVDFDALEAETTIGTGGTADVVKMTETGAGTVVAVKQPRLEGTLNEQVAEEFVAEAETWEKLDDNDGIVGVVDWEEKPLPRIALEYMDGGALTDRIGETSPQEGLWIGGRVADAVWDAHRRGVAHLDLKPDNVLFRTTATNRWDVPKVSDWGLARLLLHHSQSISGLSPQYSAPEQFDPDTYGRPEGTTDIYQLGVIVYELLTGEPLFAGQATTVMNKHLTESPPLPTGVNEALPAAVDDVLGTALAKEADDRYESMLDFRRDLTALFRQVALGEDVAFVCHRRSTGRRDGPEPGEQTRAEQSEEDAGDPGYPEAASGAAFTSDDGTPGVLDNIREHSESETDHQFPWQQRDEAPGLDRNANGSLERTERRISSQTSERLQETPGEEPDSGGTQTASGGGLLALIGELLRRL